MRRLIPAVIRFVPETMPIAVMPSGQTKYVDHNLDVSVAVRDKKTCLGIEQLIRETFASDPRQLAIRVQGDGGFGPWMFWVTWGGGADRRSTEPVILPDNERTPEAVVARIKAQLDQLH